MGGGGGSSPIVARARVTDPVRVSDKRQLLGRYLRWALMALSLGLLTRMAATHYPEIRDAVGRLLTQRWWLVLGALLLETVWLYSLANVYRASLHALDGSLSRRQAVRISMGAFSLSRILPGGGAAGSVFAARELVALGNPVPRTVASMLISWWVSMTTLALVVGVGTAIGIPNGHVGVAHLAGPGIILGTLVTLGAIVMLALRRAGVRARLVSVLSRVGSRLGVSASSRDWEERVTTPVSARRLLPLVGWAAVSWMVDAAALWLMFRGFGVAVHPAVLLVGYGLANLINALPELTPGWLGVLESALAAAYAALGVPVGIAVVAVLCYRLVSYWLPVAVGIGPGLSLLRRRAEVSTARVTELELSVAA